VGHDSPWKGGAAHSNVIARMKLTAHISLVCIHEIAFLNLAAAAALERPIASLALDPVPSLVFRIQAKGGGRVA